MTLRLPVACVFPWLLLFGCAAAEPSPVVKGPRVTEVMHEVRVCVDEGTLPENAQVRFVRNVCRPASPKAAGTDCRWEPVGTGRVSRSTDAKCAMVVVPVGSEMLPGDRTEVLGP